jgi:hypothetical protein
MRVRLYPLRFQAASHCPRFFQVAQFPKKCLLIMDLLRPHHPNGRNYAL